MDKDFMLAYYDKMVRPIWTELMKTPRYQRAACEHDKLEREFRRLLGEKLGRKYHELDDALFRVMDDIAETMYAHCAGSGLGACHGKPQQWKVHPVLYGRDAPFAERGADCGVFRGDLEAFPQVGRYSHGADPERERPSFFA